MEQHAVSISMFSVVNGCERDSSNREIQKVFPFHVH